MHYYWMTLAMLVATVSELIFGCHHLFVPLLSLTVFHFGVMRQWRSTLYLGGLFGVILDLAYARAFPIHLLILPCVMLLSRHWARKQMTYQLVLQAIAGLQCGLAEGIFLAIMYAVNHSARGAELQISTMFAVFFHVIAGGFIAMIPWCFILEKISGALGLTNTHA